MKSILKYLIAFVLLIIVYNILLFLSSLFPSRWIEENVKESAEILTSEGAFLELSKYPYIVNDNCTDVVMINTAYSIDNTNPIFSYMSARKNFKAEITKNELPDTNGELISISSSSGERNYAPLEELDEFLAGKVTTSIEYARYWHGYLPILRILLIFFNITEIRYILFAVFLLLFIVLFILLKKEIGNISALIFVYALFMGGYFFISYSIGSAPLFIVMMLASIILLLKKDKIKNIYLYFFVIGSITNYVDFFTVPLITLGIPLFIYVLYRQKMEEKSIKNWIKSIVFTCLAWGMGYGLTWISKWIIFDILYDKKLVETSLIQVLYRSKGSITQADVNIISMIINLLRKNIFLIIIFVIAELLYIFFTRKDIKLNKNKYNDLIPVFLICTFPFIWYILVSNHSVLHEFFTYRNMIIFVIGILILINKILVFEKSNNKD